MISMDPQIARIFHQSTAISGEWYLFFSFFIFSVEGQVEPSHEGLCSKEKVQGPDLGGKAPGAVEGGIDISQDGRALTHSVRDPIGSGNQGTC